MVASFTKLGFRVRFRTTRTDATYVRFSQESANLFLDFSVLHDITRKILTPVFKMKLSPLIQSLYLDR